MSPATLPIILGKYVRRNERGDKLFDFDLIEPIGDAPNFLELRLEKWGTKWVGYDLTIGDSTIDFLTAWQPPIPIIRKLAELHKDLVFRLEYYEPGMAFRGVVTARWDGKGVLLEDNN
jgi:hypothetical protein